MYGVLGAHKGWYHLILLPLEPRPKEFPLQDPWGGEDSEGGEGDDEEDGWDKIRYSDDEDDREEEGEWEMKKWGRGCLPGGISDKIPLYD